MATKKQWLLCILIMLVSSHALLGQVNDTLNRQQLKKIILTESAVYTASITGLAVIWYGQEDKAKFSFFNDNAQWSQLDKVGHAFTAYHLSATNARLLQTAGVPKQKAYFWSGVASTAMMLPIEILDGFSPSYGASWGDALANTIGAFLPYQELLWSTQHIHPKYSFSTSMYASLRPNVLGKNAAEQWLKDYNGQTYWLSTNFNIFSQQQIFPKFLAFSIGYGANEMVYGSPNENQENGFDAYRQFYLSLDIDFSSFETNNKLLRALFYTLNLIKVPLPTLEYSKNGWRFHPLHF